MLYSFGYLFGVFLMLLMILALAAAVISRYIFNDPIFWTGEFARIVLIWTIFVGAALALKRDSIVEHISMDFFVARFQEKNRKVIDKIVLLVDLLFCVSVLVIGWIFLAKTYTIITAALEVSRAVIYLALPAFSVMSIFFILERLLVPSERESS